MYTASLYGTKPYIPSAITPITSLSHGLSYSYISSFKSQHELIRFCMDSQRASSLDKNFGRAQGTPTHIYTTSLQATRPYIPSTIIPITLCSHGLSYSYMSNFK